MKKFFLFAAVAITAVSIAGGSAAVALAQNPPDPIITITPYNTPPPTNTAASTPTPRASTGGSGSSTAFPTIKNPTNVTSVPQLVSKVIRILFGIIALAAVVVIIIAGFRMVIAGANPAERTKAKNAIVWAVIGLLVALMSFSIVSILQKLIQT